MTMQRGAKEDLLDAFAELVLERRQKHTTPAGAPVGPYMHGPGGLFGVAGIERDLFSTRIQPTGLASILPVRGSIDMNPLVGYITGFLDNSGVVANGVCDDPQVAGAIKGCLQTAAYGRYSYMTRELELNRLGQRTDRGEFLDLRVVNDPLLQENNFITPSSAMAGMTAGTYLNRDVLERMMEVGVSFQNKLAVQVYTGNPANNTGAGGYKEFPGLEILIGTDKFDAITGVRCPSLDSDVKNFNYTRVDSGGAGGQDIVNVMTYLFRYLQSNADRMGFGETTWAITMRRELFWEITAVWPCSYLTYRCNFRDDQGDARVNVDAGDQIAFRDDMRNGRYLLIDGSRVRVILDDGIVEETNTTSNRVPSTCFASDIYFIPLTVRGGLATTYWEHLDYTRGAMIGAEDGNYGQGYFWTDGGRFLWHNKPPRNWCIQMLAKIEPRLRLVTPQLAGRLNNVVYCPLQHTRSPFPTDPYFVDGGVTSRTGPSLYSDWHSIGSVN